MAGLPLHPDGCIVANIRTQLYVAVLYPQCPHHVAKACQVYFQHSDPTMARVWATNNIRIPGLKLLSVEAVDKIPGEGPLVINQPSTDTAKQITQ